MRAVSVGKPVSTTSWTPALRRFLLESADPKRRKNKQMVATHRNSEFTCQLTFAANEHNNEHFADRFGSFENVSPAGNVFR